MPSLSSIAQTDFSGGMFQSRAVERIPSNGTFDIVNGLLDEDGAIYLRGGGVYLAAAGNGEPRLVWTGYLKSGLTTVVVTSTDVYTYASGALTHIAAYTGMASAPLGVGVLNGTLHLPGGVNFDGTTWAGGSPSNGSRIAVVANRVLLGNGDKLSFSVISHQGTGNLTSGANSVASVTNTSGAFQVGQDIVADGIPLGTTITAVGAGTLTLSANATKTATAVPLVATGGNPRYDATDYLRFPTGVNITGIMPLRDRAAVFTNQGLWLVSNVALNLTDADGNVQWQQDQYSPSLSLWNDADGAIASWGGSLIVPATDAIWAVSLGVASEAPQPLQVISGPISAMYRTFVQAGYKPGQATVYRNTYMLPVLNRVGDLDSLLTCRLDATDSSGRRVFPWTRITGASAALALTLAGDQQTLLGVARSAIGSARLFRADYMDPNKSALDPDGGTYAFSLLTKDFPTGPLNSNTVSKLRVRYEMSGAGSTVSAYLDKGPIAVAMYEARATAGTLTPTRRQLTGSAAANDTQTDPEPFVWSVLEKARHVRFLLQLNSTVATRLTLRSLELLIRSSQRQ